MLTYDKAVDNVSINFYPHLLGIGETTVLIHQIRLDFPGIDRCLQLTEIK